MSDSKQAASKASAALNLISLAAGPSPPPNSALGSGMLLVASPPGSAVQTATPSLGFGTVSSSTAGGTSILAAPPTPLQASTSPLPSGLVNASPLQQIQLTDPDGASNSSSNFYTFLDLFTHENVMNMMPSPATFPSPMIPPGSPAIRRTASTDNSDATALNMAYYTAAAAAAAAAAANNPGGLNAASDAHARRMLGMVPSTHPLLNGPSGMSNNPMLEIWAKPSMGAIRDQRTPPSMPDHRQYHLEAGAKMQHTERARRSCAPCRAARRACSNQRPCQRCIARGEEHKCVEGTQQPSGRPPIPPKRAEGDHRHDSDEEDVSPSPAKKPERFGKARSTSSDGGSSIELGQRSRSNGSSPSDPDSAKLALMADLNELEKAGTTASSLIVKPPVRLSEEEARSKMFLVLERLDGWAWDGTARDGVPIMCAEPTWHLQNWNEVHQFKETVDGLRALASEVLADETSLKAQAYVTAAVHQMLKSDARFHGLMSRFREQMANLMQMGVFERATVAEYVPPMPIDEGGQPLPCITWDINARLADANAAFQKLIGYSLEDLRKVYRLASDLATPDAARLMGMLHVAAAHFPVHYYECPVTLITHSGFRLPGRLKVHVVRSMPTSHFAYCIGYLCPA